MKKLESMQRNFGIATVVLLVLGAVAAGGLRAPALGYMIWSLAGLSLIMTLLYALVRHAVTAMKE